jgi:hypothetical protein
MTLALPAYQTTYQSEKEMAHLPPKVYRHLPDIYVVSGFGIALNVEHPIGVVSSFILVAAGLFVFHFRLSHRHTNAKPKQTGSRM